MSTTIEPMEDRLIFLIGPPRSGSTMLMRILNATSQIYSRPEPHLIGPLAHLGFWETVEKAPFDQLQAQQAVREFVSDLPRGEADYYDAARAYMDTLYGRMLATSSKGERFFLDKTPANGLVLPFLAKLYPHAKYIVLTRHPAAIFASYAQSFFDGDYDAAARFNPILSRYIPAMAGFLRTRPCPLLHVQYEAAVTDPESTLQHISEFLGIPYEPDAINYKGKEVAGQGLGDPIGVAKHDRPVTSSVEKWAPEFAADRHKFDVVARQLASVPPEDLEIWGTPVQTLWSALEAADPNAYKPAKQSWDRFAMQRKVLVMLRRNIGTSALGRLVRKVRFFCDVLLRG